MYKQSQWKYITDLLEYIKKKNSTSALNET